MVSSSEEERRRIKNLLIRVGDDPKKIPGNLKGLVAVIADDMDEHKDTIHHTTIACCKHLPLKAGVFGTWLSLMNEKFRVFVHDVVRDLHREFTESLLSRNFHSSVLLLRVLFELANARAMHFHDLLSLALSLAQSSAFGAAVVVAALPWISPALVTANFAAIETIVQTVSVRLGVEHPWVGCVARMAQNAWLSEVVFRPYEMEGLREKIADLSDSLIFPFDSIDASILAGLADVSGPSVVGGGVVDDEVSYDTFLLSELIRNTISEFSAHVGECAKQILKIPVSVANFEAVVCGVVLEDMLSGGLLTELFYMRLVQVLIGLQGSVKEVYEKQLIRLVNSRISKSIGSLVLAEALAYYLTQNNYVFDWASVDLGSAETVALLTDAFTYFLRLSFHQNLLHKLPASVHALVAAEAPAAEALTGSLAAEQLETYALIREQVRVKEVELDNVKDLFVRNFELFWLALLENGSKTPTHFSKLAEVFVWCIQGHSAETLVRPLAVQWAKNPQRLEMSVQVLLRLRLLQPGQTAAGLKPDIATVSGRELGSICLAAAKVLGQVEVDAVLGVLAETNAAHDVNYLVKQVNRRTSQQAVPQAQ